MEKEAELLAKSPQYPLPWRGSAVQTIRSSGNTSKVLYMQVALHDLNGVATVTRVDDISQGFFGIRSIVVPREHRAAFDAGDIPSIIGARSGSTNKYRLQVKTITKIWQSVGLMETVREIDGAIVYNFHQSAVELKRKTFQRAHEKRINRRQHTSQATVAEAEILKDAEADRADEEARLMRRVEDLTQDAERVMGQAHATWLLAQQYASVARAGLLEADITMQLLRDLRR